MVKVSVIVPVFKVPEKYIRGCFNALLAQTMQECEFIVVSDGAPEKEYSICEEFAAKDVRFKFFRRNHEGVSSTRNFGISQASGEYITFVDSDDWIEPNCCEELFKFAQEHNSDVILFDYIPEGVKYNKCTYGCRSIDTIAQDEIDEIQKQCINLTDDRFVGAVSTICKFTKRELFQEYSIQFSNNLTRCEDRPVSYKIFEYSRKTSYLNNFFYHYQAIDTSVTHTKSKIAISNWLPYLIEIKKISAKHNEFIGNICLSSFLSSLGEEYFCNSNTKPFKKRIKELSDFVKNKDFQWAIQDATYDKEANTPFLIKLDCALFRKKTALPIWIHAIKWKICGSKKQ